jgi:Flp pilus assembly protein TadG
MKALILQKMVHFARCRSGNFALAFAVLAPLLLGLAGGVVDFMAFERQRADMQNAADLVALAAAKEASVQDWSAASVQSVAENYVNANLGGANASAVYQVQATPDRDKRQITVTISMDNQIYFLLGYFTPSPQIRVTAAAQLSNETATCLLALDASAAQALNVTGSAQIQAKGCAAYSNSTDLSGLSADNGAKLTTAFTCSSGGANGSLSSYSPAPTKDCPILEDPLINRIQPVVGACDHTNFAVTDQTVTLNPGVYCGGMLIDNDAFVTLNPGVYIINGGELRTRNAGSLTGEGVTIFFTGTDGRLMLDGTSTVSLSAPETGPTAGLIMVQDRAMALTDFEISSKKASVLLGTIYLPNGRLLVKAKNKVAETSAFTVVVARFVEVGSKTQMFLNSNYAATSVPVPDGLGPSGQPRLID